MNIDLDLKRSLDSCDIRCTWYFCNECDRLYCEKKLKLIEELKNNQKQNESRNI